MKKVNSRQIKVVIVGVFFLFIVAFGFYRSYDLIFGVKIKNVTLSDGAKYSNQVIDVSGNARNTKKLTLNDREISVDKDGNFNEKIALLLGYNIITLRAEDKFGHVDKKDFYLIGEWSQEVE